MAAKLQFAYGITGASLYAIIRNAAGSVWNTVTASFQAYSSGSFTNYDIAFTEQGSSGYYVADFPIGISPGTYSIEARLRAGGTPAESDAVVGSGDETWTGTTFRASRTTGVYRGGRDMPVTGQAFIIYRSSITTFPFQMDAPEDLTGATLKMYFAPSLPVRQNSILTLSTGSGISGQTSKGAFTVTVTKAQGLALPIQSLSCELWDDTGESLLAAGQVQVIDTIRGRT